MIDNLLNFFIKINIFIFNIYKNKYIPHKFTKLKRKLLYFHIKDIFCTIKELLHSQKSLSRFGDGEIEWLLNTRITPGFQKETPLLQHRLREVLRSDNENLMIGLPSCFVSIHSNTSVSRFFWEQFYLKYGKKVLPYLTNKQIYYDTSVSRPYIDFNTNHIAKVTFRMWKRLWNNKNILIIEGSKSHLGFNDQLFDNVKNIKRIECPYINAFESYNSILYNSLKFLNNNRNYLTLISLGPTATILSYDLCVRGFRAIDVGHIDVEYDWYLKGAKEKIDLPYHYVNEVPNGRYSYHVYNSKYKKEIVKYIN